MANEEHLKILKQGGQIWNQWRKTNPLADGEKFDLKDADLAGTDLTNADLRDVNLQGANLEGANLGQTTGLLASTLARAVLTRSELPDDVVKFDSLKVIDELSKVTRRHFVSMVVACA